MKLWGAAVLSAALLELPFPLAGPMPPWRSVFAWFGLVPLLWAILSPATIESRRPFRRAFLLAYLCGVLWYMGNCYWVRDTMLHYGDMPTGAPTLLLIAFSLVLGLYFGLFGLGVMLVRRATGRPRLALIAAPFLWVALDLAAARITSVPWDQLGYSQVDNGLLGSSHLDRCIWNQLLARFREYTLCGSDDAEGAHSSADQAAFPCCVNAHRNGLRCSVMRLNLSGPLLLFWSNRISMWAGTTTGTVRGNGIGTWVSLRVWQVSSARPTLQESRRPGHLLAK